MKKRIWELDALRGICILAVVVFHLIFDLVEIFGILRWNYPQWFVLLRDWGGVIFILLSGVCATLGSRSVRRGLIVFGCGMGCTAVTVVMAQMGFGSDLIIYFGVLHCLGICMLLWHPAKKLPWWALALLGAVTVAAGFYAQNILVESKWLFPLGFCYPGFTSSDYFPLLPHFGFFLLGGAVGKTLYQKKESLLPRFSGETLLLRPLCFCGRHSLFIYLLHQPLLYALCSLLIP